MLTIRAVAFVLAQAVPSVISAQQSATLAPSLVFDSVTVVDVEYGKLLPAQRVVIAGNRIQTVGDVGAVKLPKGAQVVNAHGKYLIPGLWDMHTHSDRMTHLFYPLLLATGVTGIRDAGSPVALDTLIQWRREILAGTRVGPPRQILSGQSIAGPAAGCQRSQWHGLNAPQTCVVDSADAVHYVDSIKAAGADMIKPRRVTRGLYFVIAAEARRLGIPFGGHVEEESPMEGSDSGARIIDHLQLLNQYCTNTDVSASIERCQAVAERFRGNGTWVVPTTFVHDGERFGFGERMSEFWNGSLLPGNWLRAAASEIDSTGPMQIIQRVGLPIVAGTDGWISDWRVDPLGFMLHGLLAGYVADGLTPLTALQSATLNPAKLLHATDSLGTVAAGKLADLVLLDADPLADITNTTMIRAVVANGRYFDRAALDRVLAEVQANAKQQP